MTALRRAALALIAVCMMIPAAANPAAGAQPKEPRVLVIEVTGLLDPVMANFIGDSITHAERENAEALVIQLDSSGGVLDTTRLERLLDQIENADVAIGVWVGEAGAKARGQAFELVRVADVSGVATRATVGADRRLSGDEAVRTEIVTIQTPTVGDFIVDLHDRTINGRTLRTARVVQGEETPRREPLRIAVFSKPPLLDRLLHAAASPSVTYLLLLTGMFLVIFELYAVGVGVAAAVGAVSLLFAAYGLDVLPARAWAVALVAFAGVSFAVDIQTGVPRVWTAIGTTALVAGSVFIYDGVRLPWMTMVVALVLSLIVTVAGIPATVRSRLATPTIGRDWMRGAEGTAVQDVDPDGLVEVQGARWKARTNRATPIRSGQTVRVAAIDGPVLEVEPLEGAAREMEHHG